MKSRLTTANLSWSTRKRRLREDYESNHWDFLFFKIWIGLLDAEDAFDYRRENLFREMLDAFRNDKKKLPELIEQI